MPTGFALHFSANMTADTFTPLLGRIKPVLLAETFGARLSSDDEENLDATIIWTGDVAEFDHRTVSDEAPVVDMKDGQDESDEEEPDTVAQEEVLMTQVMNSLKNEDGEKEVCWLRPRGRAFV